jgi:uncharacterized DUF497 family protein
MRLHETFEWDGNKADRNLRKHGVSFEDAARVLSDAEGDRYHVEEFDDEHAEDEDRYVTTASHPDDRDIVLRIVWTDRSITDERVTRIISARAATMRERKAYGKEIGSA